MGALLAPLVTETRIATQMPVSVPLASPWVAVRQRFRQFHENISLTLLQKVDGRKKLNGVLSCLNQYYYGHSSEEANGVLIGSWGKDLATRPPRDVDVYFELPPDVYYRFENRLGNRQSALLQEVRGVLLPTYSGTTIQADRHVVLVGFGSYAVEVVPAFLLTDGCYWVCDTEGAGRYKVSKPRMISARSRASSSRAKLVIEMVISGSVEGRVETLSYHTLCSSTASLCFRFFGSSFWPTSCPPSLGINRV